MKYDERENIIYFLISLAEKNVLKICDKKSIIEISKKASSNSMIQRRRFLKFYGFYNEKYQSKQLKKLSEQEKCSSSAYRYSVLSFRSKLIRLDIDSISKIKNIVNQYREE